MPERDIFNLGRSKYREIMLSFLMGTMLVNNINFKLLISELERSIDRPVVRVF